ncbi:MAG: carboxymuconolactone decarboxylase family protein [Planctomycetes bacterium]|nr:carboxymuconolactone decarboxylase family protein [Planctomycetota bacterium]
MTALRELLARPGLAVRLRVLVLVKIAAWRGDSVQLGALYDLAREHLVARADVEETLLQAVLFCGFPRVVTAFQELVEHWPTESPPPHGCRPREDWPRAGRELFDAIYDRNAPAVHAMLNGFHPDFHDFVLESAYGRVLSRQAMAPRDRELLATGILAAMEQVPQLVAHARGALRFGADRDELRETLWTALGDGHVVDEYLRRIR